MTIITIDGIDISLNQALAMANKYWQQGDLLRAKTIFAAVEFLVTKNAVILEHFSGLFFKLGELTKTEQLLEKALKIQPNKVSINVALGGVFYQQKKFKQALCCYQVAVNLQANNASHWFNLALVHLALTDYQKSNHACNQAILLEPDNAIYHGKLAECLIAQIKLPEAKQSISQALKLNKDDVFVCEILRKYFQAQKNVSNTEESCFRFLYELFPNALTSYSALAVYYERANKLEKAKEITLEGLTRFPKDDNLSIILAKVYRRLSDVSQAFKQLNEVEPNNLALTVKLSYHFEMARLLDKEHDQQQALKQFQLGNDTSKTIWLADNNKIPTIQKRMGRFKQTYKKNWISDWRSNCGWDNHDTPIFSIGFPRSGTTLLDRILDRHSAITTLSEKDTVRNLLKKIQADGKQYPNDLPLIDKKYALQLREEYYANVTKYTSNQGIIVDKMPLNTLHVGLLHQLFPNAKFIFSLRHPYDVCLSCFMQNFQINHSLAYFLELKSTAEFYKNTFELWQHYQRIFNLNVFQIKYENMVNNFDTEVSQLLTFLDLEWEDGLKDFHKNTSPVRVNTPSYSQVSQPLYKEVEYRWRKYPEAIDIFEPIIGQFVEQFGYDK